MFYLSTVYYSCIGTDATDVGYSVLTEEIELSHKAPKFKVGDRVMIRIF